MQTYAITKQPVVFWGAGNLAWSLANGMLKAGVVVPHGLRVTNQRNEARLERFLELGLTCERDRASLLEGAGTVLLLVKPQDAALALTELAPYLSPGMLLISAVAGLPLGLIQTMVPSGVHLVRAMPNTSCQVGEAATAFAAADGTPSKYVSWTQVLMEAVGTVHQVQESQLDAVTAVSGTGPAYFYYFCETLMLAAQRVGLDKDLSRSLIIQTLRGAAAMLAEPDADPAVLRAQVTSARGTTEAGLRTMAEHQLPEAVVQGVLSAARRSREMGLALFAPAPPVAAHADAVADADAADDSTETEAVALAAGGEASGSRLACNSARCGRRADANGVL